MYFKDYAFEWELTKQHNLTNKQIQYFSQKLNEQGLISFRLLSELSENQQEAIMRITPDYDKVYAKNPKVYIITPKGKEEGKEILVEALKESKTNQAVYDLISQLKLSTEAFRKVKKLIKDHESNLYLRQVTYPNGVTIEKPTQKLKALKYDIESGLMQLRNPDSTDLVINNSSTQLALIDKVNKDLNTSTQYQGVYSHLTSSELESLRLSQLPTDKEILALNKQTTLQAQEIFKQHDTEYENLMYKGKTLSTHQRKVIDDEAMNFLDNLGKK